MAAPTTPVSSWANVAFYQQAIDIITICSNLAIPLSTDAAQTGVFGGTSAALMIAALTTQRGFV